MRVTAFLRKIGYSQTRRKKLSGFELRSRRYLVRLLPHARHAMDKTHLLAHSVQLERWIAASNQNGTLFARSRSTFEVVLGKQK